MADEHNANGDETNRRDFLYLATGAFAAIGAANIAWPLIHQMNPDASVKALASIEVDLAAIETGQSITVTWRGKPVFIRRRTEGEIAEARSVAETDMPDPQNDDRSRAKRRVVGDGRHLHPFGLCAAGPSRRF